MISEVILSCIPGSSYLYYVLSFCDFSFENPLVHFRNLEFVTLVHLVIEKLPVFNLVSYRVVADTQIVRYYSRFTHFSGIASAVIVL